MSADLLLVGRWDDGAQVAPGPLFLDARVRLPAQVSGASIVAHADDEAIARSALAAGAAGAFVGGDSARAVEAVARLADEFGRERVGVWADVARLEVRWRLETESNADFRTLAPSMPEACWEMLGADGTPTGMRIDYWLQRVFHRGATSALLRVDLATYDDHDLNVCAGLVERFGAGLWLTPARDTECALDDWIRYGHATRFVVPSSWRADAATPAAQVHAAA